VDKDVKGKLINIAGRLRKLSDRFRESGMEVGEAVHEAHEVLATERKGLFEQWVECETEIGLSSAYNLKNVYERNCDFPIIGKLPPTVAYLLAAPGTPKKAIEAVEKAVGRGAKPTVELAKSEIKKHSDKPAPKKAPEAAKASTDCQATSPAPQPAAAKAEEPAAGSCPKGGDHELDEDRVCMKCHDPDPELHVKIKEQNRVIESFARAVMASFDGAPSDPWLDDSRLGIARDQIKSACATIRLAKAHDLPCPKCKGAGCKTCRNCGYLPKQSYEAAGGK
jgi:hypothetical protein